MRDLKVGEFWARREAADALFWEIVEIVSISKVNVTYRPNFKPRNRSLSIVMFRQLFRCLGGRIGG